MKQKPKTKISPVKVSLIGSLFVLSVFFATRSFPVFLSYFQVETKNPTLAFEEPYAAQYHAEQAAAAGTVDYGVSRGGTDAEQTVYNVYSSVLDRAPDQSGFDHYVEALESGSMTRADIIAEFVNSEEYQATHSYGATRVGEATVINVNGESSPHYQTHQEYWANGINGTQADGNAPDADIASSMGYSLQYSQIVETVSNPGTSGSGNYVVSQYYAVDENGESHSMEWGYYSGKGEGWIVEDTGEFIADRGTSGAYQYEGSWDDQLSENYMNWIEQPGSYYIETTAWSNLHPNDQAGAAAQEAYYYDRMGRSTSIPYSSQAPTIIKNSNYSTLVSSLGGTSVSNPTALSTYLGQNQGTSLPGVDNNECSISDWKDGECLRYDEAGNLTKGVKNEDCSLWSWMLGNCQRYTSSVVIARADINSNDNCSITDWKDGKCYRYDEQGNLTKGGTNETCSLWRRILGTCERYTVTTVLPASASDIEVAVAVADRDEYCSAFGKAFVWSVNEQKCVEDADKFIGNEEGNYKEDEIDGDSAFLETLILNDISTETTPNQTVIDNTCPLAQWVRGECSRYDQNGNPVKLEKDTTCSRTDWLIGTCKRYKAAD